MSDPHPPTRAWRNASVQTFAAGRDPLVAAKSASSDLLRIARSHGLAGPPVDVLALAAALGLTLRAKDDLEDAQIRPADPSSRPDGGDLADRARELVVEYNPSRPRGRLRFSIAHEIGHLCFPDVANGTHRRSGSGAVERREEDEWEVELLCNLIASDLLLPDHSVAGLVNTGLDLDFVMEARRRWDVSTEALLRKFVAVSDRPLLLAALSRIDQGNSPTMRVDYVETSTGTDATSPLRGPRHGDRIMATAMLRSCVAVGQVNRGTVALGAAELPAQAVGVPPYAGQRFPRVLAVIEEDVRDDTASNLAFVTGDLLDLPAGDGPVVFAHVVPDTVRAWSRFGVGARLARSFPELASAFRAWTIASPDNLQLGNAHIAETRWQERRVFVASLVAQEGYGRQEPTRLRYDALHRALSSTAEKARRVAAEMHMPRLGAGAAGGRWDYIERIITETTSGLEVVVHTLPAGARRGVA